MFDKFTDRSKKVMSFARVEAARFDHEYLGTEHILLGLAMETSGVAAAVLRDSGIEIGQLQADVAKLVKRGSGTPPGQIPFTPRAKRVLEMAFEEAQAVGHGYIGTEHLLLGLIRENEGIAAQVLMNAGARLDDMRGRILEFLGIAPVRDPKVEAVEAVVVATAELQRRVDALAALCRAEP